MRDSPEFQERMFSWLDSIIKCQLPSTTTLLEEADGALKAPDLPAGKPDPRLSREPKVLPLSESEFEVAFRETVEDLAILFNWHDHKETCWKHLKNGEPRIDENCRMRIDGSTNPFTHLDKDTESIILKRLHPRINNYNDLIIFLLRCNMDIKYVGSGEAAKALVYYVTDYITKGTLSTHVGLAALEYAIKRNNDKFDPTSDTSHNRAEVNRSLFTKTVMALMSKQEMSHQQVMSYLVGGGDCYTSHHFKIVKWGDFDRLIAKAEMASHITDPADTGMDYMDSSLSVVDAGDVCTKDIDLDDQADDDERAAVGAEEVTVVVNDNFVGIASNIQDYPKRSLEPAFDKLCLWDHEELVVKISRASEEKRAERAEEKEQVEEAHHVAGATHNNPKKKPSGRKAGRSARRIHKRSQAIRDPYQQISYRACSERVIGG
ncbi:hypothetical protein B0H13DRAFT_1629900 [Mycena leptocephala]|nr:hypothetical protein B0H13DRAFT_1629900 [Mycena leptocephala]